MNTKQALDLIANTEVQSPAHFKDWAQSLAADVLKYDTTEVRIAELTAALKEVREDTQMLLDGTADNNPENLNATIRNIDRALQGNDTKQTLDAENSMTVMELLEYLDGSGINITDDDLITEALAEMGKAPFDFVQTFKPSEVNG